jgi:hypothetical protein
MSDLSICLIGSKLGFIVVFCYVSNLVKRAKKESAQLGKFQKEKLFKF